MARSAPQPKKSSGFRYRERSAESMHAAATQKGGAFDSFTKSGFRVFKAHDGDNEIRIMPPTWYEDDGDEQAEIWGQHYGISVYVHYGIGPDRGTYLCPVAMEKEHKGLFADGDAHCCICDERNRMDASEEDAIKELRPVKRVLVWLIDRDEESAGPQLWAMPASKVDKEIASRCSSKKTGEVIPLDHPDEGFDVAFRKEGKEERTNYTTVEIAREPSYLCDEQDVQDEWLSYIEENPLPTVLNFYDQEYIEEVFGGQARPRTASEDDKPAERSGRGTRERPASSRSRVRDEAEPTQGRGTRERPASSRSRVREQPEETTEETTEGDPEQQPEETTQERRPGSSRLRGRTPPAEEQPTQRTSTRSEEGKSRLRRLEPRR